MPGPRQVKNAGFAGGRVACGAPLPVWSRITRVALAVSALTLAGCQPAVLDPMGPVGSAQKSILIDSLCIMLAIVVPTIIATLIFFWWFRESNPRARRRPQFAYSGMIEMIVWGIPILVIILLGGVAWEGSHELDPAKPLASDKPALVVEVVALDWKWLFIYPTQGVASVNRLVIPAGTPVHFVITSASVMNAFFIPQLGSMIYAMNGMTTNLNLMADDPGTFRGISSHYSGDGFSGMHFQVEAVSDDGFKQWVDATRADGHSLDASSYAVLARQSIDVSPFTFSKADPKLFEQVVSQAIPPSAGPNSGSPSVNVSPRTEK